MEKFKHILLLLVFALGMVCVTSCGDDKDEPDDPNGGITNNNGSGNNNQTTAHPLIGTWLQDNSVFPYHLTFSSDHTGSISYTISDELLAPASRSSFTERQNFKWSTATTADGQEYCNILTTSGDDIISDGRYIFTVIGNSMSFGDMRFTKM